jgi:predicted extracellular nuclease
MIATTYNDGGHLMKLIKKLGLFVITGAMATAIGISIHQANNIRSVKAVGSTTVVISEVYGAGGNSGAVYKNDYVELYNLSSAEVSLAGWAVQQASATGTSWSVTNLSGVIAAEGYYLVHMAGGSEGAALPAADATGSSNFSGTNFKVALTNSTTKLTGTQETKSASVVDFLGAGTANAYETAASPAASTTKSVQRKVVSGVMQETDNNSQDFEAADPTPTNSQVSVAVTGVSLNKTTTTLIETQT